MGLRRLRILPRGRMSIAFIGLALLIEGTFHALLPFSAGFLTDRALIGKDRDLLALTLAVLSGGFVLAFVAGTLRDSLCAKLQSRALANIRQTMFERLQQLSLSFHAATASEDILDAFTVDMGFIERAFSMGPAWGGLAGLECIIFTGLALWLDWRVGLLSVLLWPWTILAPRTVSRHVTSAAEACKDEEVRVLGVVEEILAARQTIRAFSLEHLGIELFRKRNELLSRETKRAAFRLAFMDRFSQAGVLFLQVMILALSALLAFDGQITVGKLVSIPILTYMLAQSLQMVSEFLPVSAEGKHAWRRIHKLMRDPSPVLDRSDAKSLTPLQFEIVFNGVTFRSEVETALVNVTATVKRGQHVAFVGASGSGNGTMLRLLMRFLDPREGTVTIDGRDVKTVTQASLRARIGAVLQDNFVFSATLLENVRLGFQGASEERVGDAVRVAGIPDTMMGKAGSQISGELMQRMGLARALLRSPDVLLLDEIGSALEPAEEAAMNKTLRELPGERTTISVTHRPANIAHADFIYVFDEGHIVEQGSHTELLAMNGFYAELWRKQSGFHFLSDGSHVDVDPARLRQLPVFEAVDEAALAEIAPHFATETWPAGRDVVCANDPGGRLYIVARGTLKVWRSGTDSGEMTCVGLLEEGDCFGDANRHTATFRTANVCTCISIDLVLTSRSSLAGTNIL